MGGAAQLIEFQQGRVKRELRLGGPALERELGGLDHAGFEQRRDAGGVPGEKRFLQRGEPVGDLADCSGLRIRDVETVGEGADARVEGGAEPAEAKLGERDLAVGDRLAQGETPRPFEGLGHRDGPRRAVAGGPAGAGPHAFVTEIEGEFRIRAQPGGANACLRGGDLGLIEAELRVTGDDVGHEGVDSQRRIGGVKRRKPGGEDQEASGPEEPGAEKESRGGHGRDSRT